jgi:hypothetical protein
VDGVAGRLRSEDRRSVLALPPADRVRLALALGRRDVETFRLAQRPALTREDAVRALERQRQRGRRPSACMRNAAG